MNLDVLAIAAHPDDVEQTCGGTLLRMAEMGYRTGVLDLTAGDMGTRGTPEQRVGLAAATSSAPFIPTLFLFDEPTTGLHFDDVRVLLKVFQRLVNSGHSVVVIEHNLDVIKSADWIIDLGPEAGDLGGQLVAQGTPEQVARCAESHTGQALSGILIAQRERSPMASEGRGVHPAVLGEPRVTYAKTSD